ncbi:MAG: amino acid adenylation domain-containing protein [Lysobacteraceae bacterium]
MARPYRAPRDAAETAVCAAFAEVLALDRVGVDDAFFELGGDSLSALRVLRLLRERGVGDLRPVQLFGAPTPAALARRLAGEDAPVPQPLGSKPLGDMQEPIAIVGMAGRFPGADDVEAFWRNLCDGRESIRFFRPDELDPSIPSALRDDPGYVPARGVLDGVDCFDAAFFGIAPLEAQLMDPQHRHFLETAWHALEHAGYVPETAPGRVGVFGGMYNATYYQRHVLAHPELIARLGEMPTMLANEKDYLTSRAAHRLGLDGPAVSVHTACSTSLVATILAMDSLRAGHCELALAGGVAITCPPNSGLLHQDGAMVSRDGHTRTFDADASGTVFSDGVAILALRRLSDAIADGDTVYAVLLGGAVNNDGADRASFTAPNPAGQAAVIALAHDAAGVDARSIGYVEAHGTATPIGDPIEIDGLTRAFRRHTADTGFCAIGSVKSNVGHLVTAAGAAGLIKTALALHRETLPPTIGYAKPNPQIDFDATPFVPQATRAAWPRGEAPRRAGVSAFGFGGTNAHVVVEEAPASAQAASSPSTRTHQLLTLSARTPEALDAACARLAAALDADASLSLADVAHTLRVARRAFPHRRAIVAADAADAVRALRTVGPSLHANDAPEAVFLCTGQGAQYAGMGRSLYASEPVFRAAYDACCDLLASEFDGDPRTLFLDAGGDALTPTRLAQPALFALEYALAALWLHRGVVPRALVGHSVGEFVCAVLAGVMSLADAVALVALRGRAMQAQPAGGMLSVRLSAASVQPYLAGTSVELAAENAPTLCVVAGPHADLDAIEARLAADGVVAKRLATSHAFHTAMMAPAVDALRARLRDVTLSPPRLPIVSTVTGAPLTDAQACDPEYWATQLRLPVRFAPAVAQALADPACIAIELGPRGTLATLARQCVPKRVGVAAIASLGDAPEGEDAAFAAALGQWWCAGGAPDWRAHVAHETRRRVALPGYPFARERYWIDAAPAMTAVASTQIEVFPPVVEIVAPPPATSDTLPRLLAMIEDVSGVELGADDLRTPWLDLGLDSLALTQLSLQLQRGFGAKIPFRQIMERYATAEALAARLDALHAATSTEAAEPVAVAPTNTAPVAGDDDTVAAPVRYDVKQAFGAIARIHTRADALTPQQRARLDGLIARYTARTARSKAYTVEHRPHMADPRVVNGFRPLTKELTYQLVIERSRGSRLWDIDGNEYVDVLNGFGMNLFGWQPDFLRETLHERIDLGYEIGPQHVLAGETAKLFAEVTGAERVAFCNTGSEAVMGCMRIARTVTGRSTIAIFTGAYHGIFDEVIVRGTKTLRSVPAAPGIMPSTAQNVLVLDYGTEDSLRILRERAHELAAILVEPVQSRRPALRPVEFLRDLRTLCDDSGALLVFDEVVTGFRAHPAGVQGLFGIQADLASYGKVVGGGFSIGVIAGKRPYMDALDGGHWQYGDDSVPTVGVTYFAGTFVRHPLALAATKATLAHLQAQGPELQAALTARTSAMVERVNAAMAELGAPFKLVTFASWWRNVFTEDLPYNDLIYTMLRDRGVHILDNFPCFLTTSHSDADIDRIVEAYRAAAAEMIASGFFPERRAALSADDGVRLVPTTEAQREVWLADRLGTEASLAYNESVSLHLRGALDVEALRDAVRALPRHHDALRATFSEDGLTLRVPAGAPVLDVPLRDVSADADPQAALAAIAARHVSEPFDVAAGPLLRAEVLKLAPEHHVLVLSGHHIVLDGWSFWVLVKDLAATCRGDAPTAAPSFADYAIAQAQPDADARSAREADLAWWAHLFADGGPVLALPTDRPRPPVRTQRAGREDRVLPADLLARVRKLGAAHGASLFATLIAGFGTLLHRLTGEDDVVVGVPAAGQAAAGLEGLVGHCVHMLPLRLSPQADQPFGALVDACRATVLDAYDHQSVTFGRLLQALPMQRDRSRLPLMPVVFNIDQALGGEHHAIPGVALDLQSNARVFETFELFVNAVDLGADGLRVECQYNADLFDARTVARWLACFETLLEGAVADAGVALGALPLLGDDDRAQLSQWNATAAPLPDDPSLSRYLDAALSTHADRVAMRFGDTSLTYADLSSQAQRIANALRARGVGAGDVVGLYLQRTPAMLAAVLGVLRAGAAYLPMDPYFPAYRLRFMLDDAAAKLVLSDGQDDGLQLSPDRVLLLDAALAASDAPFAPMACDRDALAYLIYTSGSTGTPKGVRVPQRAVVAFLEAMRRAPGLSPDARLAAVTTLSFDIAVLELLLPLTVGARIVLVPRETGGDGVALRDLLEREAVDTMQATPVTWRLLLEAGWHGGPQWTALCGGEALPVELAEALLPRVGALWNLYGPTETTVWSTCTQVLPGQGDILIGRPIANTRVHVVDATGKPVPIGVAGELVIAGAGVTLGYHARPELTAEKFIADPDHPGATMYRTGDLGRWRADGMLQHLGRLDHQVKLRGYRIETGEIEAVLARHADVAQAVVVLAERAGDAVLAAYVKPRDGAALDVEALRTHLRGAVPEYMVPGAWITIDAVPMTPNGKVDRRALPALANDAVDAVRADGMDDAIAFDAPYATEVAAAFREALGLPQVSAQADFFRLGGHSLSAAQLAVRLGRTLGRAVPLRAVFDHPTVASLAAHLHGEDVAAPQTVPALADGARAPLSLMQQRLWYLEQLHPGRTVYNVPSAHRLRGALDRDALQSAFATMVARQASLRTRLPVADGEPWQDVLETVDATIPVEDLTRLPADAREGEAMRRIEDEIAQPFDLAHGPLFRVRLYALSADDHVLFFMAHHAIWDGWSFDLFYEEMAALYADARRGCAPSLAPLPVQYVDFAAWHRTWMDGPELARQLAHWQARLAGAPEALALPTDLPRPATQTGAGDTAWLRLPEATTSALRTLAQREGTTLFTVLLSAWAVLLHQATGQRDLLIGTPVRGRSLPELEPVVGFFVNALPLRLKLDPLDGFRTLLQAARAEMIDAFGCQDVPFEHLVRVLDTRRDTSRFPIYQAFFSYQDARGRPARWDDLAHANVPVFQAAAAQDVALWFLDGTDGLVGGLNYNTDILLPQSADRFRDRYLALLDALAAGGDSAALQTLQATPASEMAQLSQWNATDAPLPDDPSLSRYLDAALSTHADRVAMRFGDTSLTYADLSSQAQRIANALRDCGVGAGDVVGLHLQRTPAMLAAVLGILRAGAAYLPMDPHFPADRLRFMLDDASAKLVLSDGRDDGLQLQPDRVLPLDVALAASDVPFAPIAFDRDAFAYLIYTSGSTGTPKGVRVPQRAVVAFLEAMRRAPGLSPDARLAAVTTLSFDIAVLELLLPLTVGARIVLVPRETGGDGVALRDLLEREAVDTMQATPVTWRLLLEAGWRGGPQWTALCGGEALPVELAEALLPRVGSLWNLYGPTETTVWSTCVRIEPGQGDILIGKPIANTRVHVVDAAGKPVPIGVAGELVIAGAGVTLGYHARPELTAEKFIADPDHPGATMYRTGDLGRWRADGMLQHLGRLDHQVKLRGYRIETGEIEAVLARHADVAQAVVVLAERASDAVLAAYVKPRDGAALDVEALRSHLRGAVPEYMVPGAWVAIDAVPMTPNGKVDRRALPAIAHAAAPAGGARAPSTDAERMLADLWCELLGIDRIGVDDHFLDLGGHSLLIMRAVALLQSRHGVVVGPRAFVFQTLGQIAAECEPQLATASDDGGNASAHASEPPRRGVLGRLFARLGGKGG